MRLLYHSIIAFCLLLFIGMQGSAAAHAASHIDEHHENECVVCEVIVAGDEQNALLPTPNPKPALYIYEPARYKSPSVIEHFKQAPACIPPPRAPPA